MIRHVPLRVLAGRIAALRAAELELFEVLGAAARDVDDPIAKPILATCAQHLAWHAELWARRMPSIPGVDVDTMTAAARGQVATEPLAALDDIARRCEELARDVDPVLDPSTLRVCDLVATDVARDWAAIASLTD